MKDEDLLKNLGLTKGGKIYFKDLGPQVGWTTVSQFQELWDSVVRLMLKFCCDVFGHFWLYGKDLLKVLG